MSWTLSSWNRIVLEPVLFDPYPPGACPPGAILSWTLTSWIRIVLESVLLDPYPPGPCPPGADLQDQISWVVVQPKMPPQ